LPLPMLPSPSPSRKIPSSLVALKLIVEGTSTFTGKKFFASLVQNLAEVLDVHGVWVTEFLAKENRLRALAFWLDGAFVDEYEYEVAGTPCEPVLGSDSICHIPANVIELYPNDPDLPPLGAVSYMGLVLKDTDGTVLGHLALLDNKPMEEIPEVFAIFRIFASRAAAELRRVQAEKLLLESEARLKRLFNGTTDAILELDQHLEISQANQAALRAFALPAQSGVGKPVRELLSPPGWHQLVQAVRQLENRDNHQSTTQLSGHLECLGGTGDVFPAEATLSRYRSQGQSYYALFLRNLQDQVQQEKQLKRLHLEASQLRERVRVHEFEEIIGQSAPMLQALELVRQVAPTDATVLIRGETGTGKELFARAIQSASLRQDKPYVTLNCATLPAELIESELFGHVKGAFTGASLSREGRFALAHQGTIFLDEIGELPLPLQAKLLRVLQEGEFEAVGSSKTQKVNVRIIAATNRELEKEVAEGRFREDLFYRLNVFPLPVPPLRERGRDILLLAEAFVQKYAGRFLRTVRPLDLACQERLLAYPWPGNVRELQNIIERSLITCREGKIDLLPLLPLKVAEGAPTVAGEERILTEAELLEIEKRNILRALDKAGWKVSGENGAARLLQVPPTTLTSRIKKLNLQESQTGGNEI
jgi:PAS domain S-box-containing protein